MSLAFIWFCLSIWCVRFNFKFGAVLKFLQTHPVASLAENLRVVNGSNRCHGRVEVYNDGRWKRVCNSDWGKEQADVVCQEINCGSPVTQTKVPYFGEGTDLDGVKATCSGNETSISQCAIRDFKESCFDATVVCSSMSFNLLSHV